LANHGTLFLDEVGDMPPSLQTKLLRVLQEREVEPVGGNSLKQVDVRVITASHKIFEDLVEKRSFPRGPLPPFERAQIEIPALRDRTEDIEPLVAYFTKAHWKSMGLSSEDISRARRSLS